MSETELVAVLYIFIMLCWMLIFGVLGALSVSMLDLW